MLRLGLVGGRSVATARDRLLELGAVQAGDGLSCSLHDPGVVLFDVADVRDASLQHLAVEVIPPGIDVRVVEVQAADVRIEGWNSQDELLARIDALWRERLVPFEANLRTMRRAPRRRKPALAGPNVTWTGDAARLVDRLHAALGTLALRIDHIGSTSVPGLRAKDLIDIQVTVRDLTDAGAAATAARDAGFVRVEGAWFGEDRFGGSTLRKSPWTPTLDAQPT